MIWKVFSLAESAASDSNSSYSSLLIRKHLSYSHNVPISCNASLYYEDSFLDVGNVLLTLNYSPLGAIANKEYFHKAKRTQKIATHHGTRRSKQLEHRDVQTLQGPFTAEHESD